MPRVSVIIPVYNGADFLHEAIQSARNQDYGNIEIVVVNDGSTDDGATEAIALHYGSNVRLINQPNGGVASALNRGVSEMTGDYFTWLSHDDVFTKDKISKQVAFIGMQPEPDNCIAYSDYEVFGEGIQPNAVRMPAVRPQDFRYFITTQNIVHGCTLMIPRAAFTRSGLFDVNLKTTQDYDLWFKMACKERFIHQREVFVRARAHANQGTVRMSDRVLRECNDLLGSFAERLTIDEIERGTSRSGLLAFTHIANNLYDRGFEIAAARATSRGREYVLGMADELRSGASQRARDVLNSLLELERSREQPDRAHREKLNELALKAAAERDELLAQNGQLMSLNSEMSVQLEELRQMISDTHASTSWRLTGPIRRIRTWQKRIV